MIKYNEYIISDPQIMLGKPIIMGTRITVELILTKLADGYNLDEILESYPHLSIEQIRAALKYASNVISNEEMIGV